MDIRENVTRLMMQHPKFHQILGGFYGGYVTFEVKHVYENVGPNMEVTNGK